MKKLVFILVSVITLSLNVTASIPCYVPTSGLIAWYPFNGNANDSSGNGHHGTNYGASLTTDRFGNSNKAYYFSGSGCATRIEASINTSSISTGYSINLWVNRNNEGCMNPRILEFGNGAAYAGDIQVTWPSGSGTAPHTDGYYTNTPIGGHYFYDSCFNNVWYNLTITYDGNNLKLYGNGILYSTTSIRTSGSVSLFGNVAFGRMNHSGYDAFNGKIDDIGIWNRVLTQDEVTELYNSGRGAASIQGPASVNVGGTINLTDSTTGGIWSSSNTSRATVNSSGVVRGVSAGSVTISYSVTTSCGTNVATKNITVNSVTSLPCYLPTSGLLAWYPFNGNANDESGNGNNLVNNSCTFTNDRYSRSATAGDLHGTNRWFGASTSNPTVQPILSTGSNSSVSMWVKISAPSFGEIYHEGGGGSPRGFGLYVLGTDSGSRGSSLLVLDNGVNGDVTGIWSGRGVHLNFHEWHNIALVKTSNSVVLYFDGSYHSSGTLSFSTLGTGWLNFGVPDAGEGHFEGQLDDIAMYNRALSAYEISQLYNSGRSVAAITGPTSVTIDSSITLSDSTAGGTWSSSNSSRATVTSSGVVRGVSSGSVTISYTVTNACGTSRATKNVNVIAPTNAPIFIVGTPSYTTVCKNQSKIISDNIRVRDIDSGQTLTWSLYRAPRFGSATVAYTAMSNRGIIRPPSDRLYTPNTNYVGNDSFMVRVTDGTYSAYLTIYVTVNPTPTAPTIYGDTILCRSASTTLTATPSGGTWFRNIANLSVSSSGVVSSITRASGFTDYITYFTPANSFGCKNSTRHYISVPYMPDRISITGSSVGTVGGTANYSGVIAGGTWSVRDTGIAYFSSGGVANFTNAGTSIISYSVSRCGTTFNASKSISVAASKQQGIVKQEVEATQEIAVYPNPTKGELNIDMPMEQATILLYDINGKVILAQEATSQHQQLDLSNYPKGIYMLVVASEGNKWVHRVILQ